MWPNKKVRDLFDSMYLGYPVGYFLFWQNGFSSEAKQTQVVDGTKGIHAMIAKEVFRD